MRGDRDTRGRHRGLSASRTLTVLTPVIVLAVLALCGLLVLGLATVQVGVLAVVIGVLAAVVPVTVVVAAFLWIDRWEPEPAKLLLLTFLWGACVATLSALLVNDTAQAVGELLLGADSGARITTLVSAPLAEELLKAVPLVLILWRRSDELDGVVDGIVYAGFSAAGFAFTENVYYFGRAFAENGIGAGASSGVVAAFFLRGVLSPFAHPLFTAITGIGAGYAARFADRRIKVLLPLGAYVGAVLLHAMWNAAATLGGPETFLNVYFLIMVPLFVVVLMVVLWQRRREQRIVAAALPRFVTAGLVADSEVGLLSDLAERRRWRRMVRRQTGRRAAQAVAAYQSSVTELAFLRRKASSDDTARERDGELVELARVNRTEAVRLATAGTPRPRATPAR